MAQGTEDRSADDADRAGSREHERWPNKAPTAAVARVVLEIDEVITLKRRAAGARLTANGHAVPLLPIKPSRLELAVVIALAETFGAALCQDTRFVAVVDFIADYGAVALVQRVVYGARPDHDNSDDSPSAIALENEQLAELLREARVAFEFLCATRPESFLAQAHGALARIGVRGRPPDAYFVPPRHDESAGDDGECDEDDEDGHA